MDLKFCLKESHQGQPVSFILKQNNHWTLCCGICQYESDLPKKSFKAIKDLEKINKETITVINSSEIINQLQNSLKLVKDWQTKFENYLVEVKNLFLQKINYYNSLIETLNEKIEFFILNDDKLQEVLNCSEKINFLIIKQADELKNLEMDLKNAYEILKQSSISELVGDDIKINLVEVNQKDNKENIQSNSIIKEQSRSNDSKEKIIKNSGDKLETPQGRKNSNIQDQVQQLEFGKLQINENEYYEGQLQKGMMHGEGKLIKTNLNYEFIYEGQFQNNQKHGRGKETIIEFDIQDLSQSFFKKMTIYKSGNSKKTELIGEFKNNKKIEIFTKILYNNDVKKSESYQFYENDVLIGEDF
ncbi:unnamed protein product [Paramecium sonneborni]|uniref:Uncharacterized protein n=1 Tax=Paramecium sonneborni TaxID=65129 RepID=A0A8S1NP40_9CILI|nr:unnamed protein product [Paramecium sonneborni]